jgi:hypothetical protein
VEGFDDDGVDDEYEGEGAGAEDGDFEGDGDGDDLEGDGDALVFDFDDFMDFASTLHIIKAKKISTFKHLRFRCCIRGVHAAMVGIS